jgi:hypothetical protein
VRRVPREVGPLLLGSCLVFGLFYLFGRQAFCNYYYLVDATALFAAATLTRRRVAPWSTPLREERNSADVSPSRPGRPDGRSRPHRGALDCVV